VEHLKLGSAPALTANIRPSWKGLLGTNAHWPLVDENKLMVVKLKKFLNHFKFTKYLFLFQIEIERDSTFRFQLKTIQ
jgi:hypothetical protein